MHTNKSTKGIVSVVTGLVYPVSREGVVTKSMLDLKRRHESDFRSNNPFQMSHNELTDLIQGYLDDIIHLCHLICKRQTANNELTDTVHTIAHKLQIGVTHEI